MASNRAMDVIANNLANLSTPAFKREAVEFQQFMVPVQATEAEGAGTVNVSFVLDHGVTRDLTEGRMEQTGGSLDSERNLNGIEKSYQAMANEARNQYTWFTPPTSRSSTASSVRSMCA